MQAWIQKFAGKMQPHPPGVVTQHYILRVRRCTQCDSGFPVPRNAASYVNLSSLFLLSQTLDGCPFRRSVISINEIISG